jgi:CubicO group peptidase (beta-lactamase class C family)
MPTVARRSLLSVALCGALLVGRVHAQAQEAPPWVAEVDALFATWDKPGSPGCALGVIQDGELVHARGFGEASLEHGVKITPATVFDIGSTSKQFTAAAIGLLVQDGKVEVEQEIHEWVDELGVFDHDVTLDHLLRHTSGLPDYIDLMTADEADVTTPAQALEALAKVEQLHFEPGTRFEYSNTNYFLLSLVIERASDQQFQEFARARLFAPLGMTSTLLFHDHTLVIPRRACAYAPRKAGGFRVYLSNWEQLGDGAVQTSLLDLARWDANYYTRTVGGDALHAFLHTTAPLADGRPNDYARGLFVDRFLGRERVSHSGSWAGYRAEMMRFPAERTSIVCLANLATINPTELCERVAVLVLASGAK